MGPPGMLLGRYILVKATEKVAVVFEFFPFWELPPQADHIRHENWQGVIKIRGLSIWDRGVVHIRNICSAAAGVRPAKVTVYSMKCAAVHFYSKDNKTR